MNRDEFDELDLAPGSHDRRTIGHAAEEAASSRTFVAGLSLDRQMIRARIFALMSLYHSVADDLELEDLIRILVTPFPAHLIQDRVAFKAIYTGPIRHPEYVHAWLLQLERQGFISIARMPMADWVTWIPIDFEAYQCCSIYLVTSGLEEARP